MSKANRYIKPFNERNKKEKLEARKTAYKTWALSIEQANNPEQVLEACAVNSGMSIDQVCEWKQIDKWEKRFKKDKKDGTFKKEVKEGLKDVMKERHVADNDGAAEEIHEMLHNSGLTDKHQLFVMHYLKSFNASQAAMDVGYTKGSANTAGSQLTNHPNIKQAIKRAKKLMQTDVYINGLDVLNEYIRVAFADITDFVEFDGQTVRMRRSHEVDGRLITEVKQGRDGISVKLADKMRALDKLEKLFDVIPDKKLLLEQQKFELQKNLADKAGTDPNTRVTIVNDIR